MGGEIALWMYRLLNFATLHEGPAQFISSAHSEVLLLHDQRKEIDEKG